MGKVAPRVSLDFTHLAATCSTIGNETADGAGFVAIRALLKVFRAELILRPLLVEAMITYRDAGASPGSSRWVLLVDSERYPIAEDLIREEAPGRSLPFRFRFTIAHELAHALAFRPAEFGIQSEVARNTKISRSDFVSSIERQTDQVSPLLLLPEKALTQLLTGRSAALTADDLQSACRHFGTSRDVIINRLLLLLRRDDLTDLREKPALTNVGIGIGEWTETGEAVLRKWPLFINFRNGIVPSLLLKLLRRDHLPVKALIDNSDFILCGGKARVVDFACDAGLKGNGDNVVHIRCTTESVNKRPGARFIFTMSILSDHAIGLPVARSSLDLIRRKHGSGNA